MNFNKLIEIDKSLKEESIWQQEVLYLDGYPLDMSKFPTEVLSIIDMVNNGTMFQSEYQTYSSYDFIVCDRLIDSSHPEKVFESVSFEYLNQKFRNEYFSRIYSDLKEEIIELEYQLNSKVTDYDLFKNAYQRNINFILESIQILLNVNEERKKSSEKLKKRIKVKGINIKVGEPNLQYIPISIQKIKDLLISTKNNLNKSLFEDTSSKDTDKNPPENTIIWNALTKNHFDKHLKPEFINFLSLEHYDQLIQNLSSKKTDSKIEISIKGKGKFCKVFYKFFQVTNSFSATSYKKEPYIKLILEHFNISNWADIDLKKINAHFRN